MVCVCVLLEVFPKFPVNTYYKPLAWFMICIQGGILVPNEIQNNIWQLGNIHNQALFSMSRQTWSQLNVWTICKTLFCIDKIYMHRFYQLFQVLSKHLVVVALYLLWFIYYKLSIRGIHNRHILYKVLTHSQGSRKELLAILHLCTIP